MRVWYECLSICSEYRNSHLNFTKQAVTLSDLFFIFHFKFYVLYFTLYISHFTLHISHYIFPSYILCLHFFNFWMFFWLYMFITVVNDLTIISDLKYSVTWHFCETKYPPHSILNVLHIKASWNWSEVVNAWHLNLDSNQ